MRKLFTFIAMAVFAIGTMVANWQPSDVNATRLDKEDSNGQVQMKTLRTDDGKIILTWLRGEIVDDIFSYQLHLQVFDANGNAMFGDEGIIVCDKRTRSWTTDYALALASNGDIIMAYTDIRNDPTGDRAESYLYRYTQQGQPVWDVDGILFPAGVVHENPLAVEDIAPAVCVSGDNIFAAVNHTEYYMEEANEDNWSPSPWFPNQQMPDSVLVNSSSWLLVTLNDDGTLVNEAPMEVKSSIVSMNPAINGNIYLVYDNEIKGLDAQMLNNGLTNEWDDVITVEGSPLTGGMFMPTPLTAVDENGYLMLSYRLLTDYYGYQVVNSISPEGYAMGNGVSLTGDIDGDAGSAAMGVKEDRAFVAWEYAYSASENRMNVNVMDENCFYTWEGDKTYGITLEKNSTWGFTPVKVIPVSTGWVVLYGNCTSWNGANFMVVMLDDSGEVVWTKQICEDDFKSSGFAVTYDENNAYIFYTQDEEYDENWEVIPGSGGMYVMCVDIAGQATAINEVETDNEPVKVEIYTVDGRRVDKLQNGVNIIRTTDASGNVTTKKVMN